jgi:hypothetical protein
MLTRRAAVADIAAAAVAGVLVLTACEPLDTAGQGKPKATKSSSARSTHRVDYEAKGGKAPARRSVVVRSGSVASVTSRGSGSVSCRIVVDGRTVVRKTGSGSVTCSARVSR